TRRSFHFLPFPPPPFFSSLSVRLFVLPMASSLRRLSMPSFLCPPTLPRLVHPRVPRWFVFHRRLKTRAPKPFVRASAYTDTAADGSEDCKGDLSACDFVKLVRDSKR
ncbi:hypothetical protein PFISCL1PPCAC_16403, partial [Pristionchus fissidentatus]